MWVNSRWSFWRFLTWNCLVGNDTNALFFSRSKQGNTAATTLCHDQANLQPGSLQNGARKAHGRRHLDPLDEVQFVIDKNAKVTVATFYLILINHKGTRIYRLTASEYIIFTEMSSYFTKMHKSSKPNQDGVHRKLQQFDNNITAKRHNHHNLFGLYFWTTWSFILYLFE